MDAEARGIPAKTMPVALALIALFAAWQPAPARAADPEVSKEIIAVQLRKQGFECKNPESAEREKSDSKPDDTVWLLTCEGARYKVQLIPKMAAKVEKLPDETPPDDKAGTQTPAAP